MESASALLQLVRDAAGGGQSSTLSESDLIHQLESTRKQLQRPGSAAIRPESSAIAACHVTSQAVAYLVQYRPLPAHLASSKWQKRVLLLETAVASAFTVIRGSEDAELEVQSETRGDLCIMYKKLLQRLWEISPSPQQAINVVAIMTKLGLLLAICWLSYDRVGRRTQVEKLLNLCSDFCLEHKLTEHLAKWPLFLRGMVNMVEKQDYSEALKCFKSAVECSDEEDGVCFYWYAVALIRNGNLSNAISALDKCIRANYEPAGCLSLQALVNLQAEDFYAASEQLQRALGIDFAQSGSLFNYALLMERMGNFEAQQQLLEYVLGCHGDETDKKRKQPGDDPGTAKASAALFDEASMTLLLPSQLTSVNTSMVHLHLAVAAMENGNWLVSKKHFEDFIGREDLRESSNTVLEAVRDYVYVLLQCKLPSLALSKCEQYLLEFEGDYVTSEDNDIVTLLLLHLYKADALLCLERVAECCKYLKQTAQPKIQDTLRQSSNVAHRTYEEIQACHTQLLNNLAVVVACSSDVDAVISILCEGLQQYPKCLTIKFNLVLLLWRKGDQAAAASVWVKARGWDLNAKTTESRMMTDESSPVDVATAYQNVAVSAPASIILEHVQGILDEEGTPSAQQLEYLDALILNYWRNIRNSQLIDSSLQYVEYIESQGTTNIPRHN